MGFGLANFMMLKQSAAFSFHVPLAVACCLSAQVQLTWLSSS